MYSKLTFEKSYRKWAVPQSGSSSHINGSIATIGLNLSRFHSPLRILHILSYFCTLESNWMTFSLALRYDYVDIANNQNYLPIANLRFSELIYRNWLVDKSALETSSFLTGTNQHTVPESWAGSTSAVWKLIWKLTIGSVIQVDKKLALYTHLEGETHSFTAPN